MNHQNIYNKIIDNAIKENRIRIKYTKERLLKNGKYYEKHHIIPKCLGGTCEKENLVLLTAKEHYVCHKLLTYIYPKNFKIIWAFKCISTLRKNDYVEISSRDYAYLKELLSKTKRPKEIGEKISKSKKGKPNLKCRGIVMSKERKLHLSLVKKGKPSPHKGKVGSRKGKKNKHPHSLEVRQVYSIALTGKPSPHKGKVGSRKGKKNKQPHSLKAIENYKEGWIKRKEKIKEKCIA